jgi:uncharacterized protein YndB with AHSA1/START domain
MNPLKPEKNENSSDIIPNKKLSYTWTFKDLPGFPETTVAWELEGIEPKKTEEKGLTSFESHDAGWTEELNKLAQYCKGRE